MLTESVENQIDTAVNQTQQELVDYPLEKTQKNKKYWVITVAILIILGIVSFLIVQILNKKDTNVTRVPTTQTQNIPRTWKTYSGNGLSFSYPSDWILTAPDENRSFGNEKTWTFQRIDKDNMTYVMSITMVKDYVPLLEYTDTLRSYFYENRATSSATLTDSVFKNRKAVRYTDDTTDIFQDGERILIDVPEQSGLLSVDFPDSFTDLTLHQGVDKYFTPFLNSLKITNFPWQKEKPVLTQENTIDTSHWKKYTGKDFSFLYPPSWQVNEAKDPDFADLINAKLSKQDSETMVGYKVPQIFIGSPIVFSASGALCGNQGEDKCKVVGTAELKIKEKIYFGSIIDKNARKNDVADLYPSFYVFRITPNRVPSAPDITVMFKDLKQGQEIMNILSSISY